MTFPITPELLQCSDTHTAREEVEANKLARVLCVLLTNTGVYVTACTAYILQLASPCLRTAVVRSNLFTNI